MGNMTATEAERFYGRTIREGTCLIYHGTYDRDGYGMFYFRGISRRAHRVAWFDQNGEIPEGMVVNHTCRRRNCVDHQHLQVVTQSENASRDSASVGYLNSQKTTCRNGHEFDKTVTWGGKTQRICTTCVNARKRAYKKRRRVEARKLRV